MLLTPHSTLGIIYYTLIKEMMNDGLMDGHQTGKLKGGFLLQFYLWCYYLALALNIISFGLMALKNKLIRE